MARLFDLLMNYRPEAAAGYVRTYTTGTTTLATKLYPTAADADAATNALSNPVSLDSNGMVECYIPDNATNFRLRIYDSGDTTIIDDVDPAVHSAGLTTDEMTLDANNNNAYTQASETLDDALDFIWKNQSNSSTASTAKDLKTLGTDTGRVGRYYYQQLSDYHNVLDYGAVGDGATNDAAAIQAAIDAAATAGGGRVWFPGGYTYQVNSSLTVSSQNGVMLVGDGPTSIIKGNFVDSPVISITGTSDGTGVFTLQVQGGGTQSDTTTYGIGIGASAVNTRISHVKVSGTATNTGCNIGIHIAGAGGFVDNCYIDRFYNASVSAGIYVAAAGWSISHCYIDGQEASGFQGRYGIQTASGCAGLRITGTYIENVSQQGLRIEDATNTTVTSCSATGAAVGAYLISDTGTSLNTCTFFGNSSSGITVTTDGTTGSSQFSISGCTCRSNTNYGIYVDHNTANATSVASDGNVSGCTLTLNGKAGILTEGDDILWSGNMVINNSTGTIRNDPAIDVTTHESGGSHYGGNRNIFTGNYVYETPGTYEHLAAIRIQRSGGGGVNNVSSTVCVGNNFPAQAANGTKLSFIYGTANRHPPGWVANRQTQNQRPTILTTATTYALTAADSGSTLVLNNASGTAVTLPALTASAEFSGLHYWIANPFAYNSTIASSAEVIYTSEGSSGTVDFDMITEATSTGAGSRGLVYVEAVWDGGSNIDWYMLGAMSS